MRSIGMSCGAPPKPPPPLPESLPTTEALDFTPAPVSHLYLHFPFCSGRCAYCAFVSGPLPKQPAAYVDKWLHEAAARQIPLAPLESLYCGGGTPVLLGVQGFRRFLNAGLFRFAKTYEWTVELHPAAVTIDSMQGLSELGVTRLSLGVQSFNDATLIRCNRRHSARQALEAIEMARTAVADTGIDLIAGLPGVSAKEWTRTLQQTVALNLPHVSVYALSIDDGSAWHRQGLPPPEPNRVCDAMAEAAEQLGNSGFMRYETSNYARPGHACRHNLNTWHGGDYLGLGHGAASRIGRHRRSGDGMEEILSPLDDALERTLTHLRLATGFDPAALCVRFPVLAPFCQSWKITLSTLRSQGLLTAENAPTLRGYEVLDAIERALL